MEGILSALAPGRGDLVALIQAYFDESYSEKGERFCCVAGYLFDPDSARALDTKWADTLRRFKDLPYFRMSSCAHGNEPFDRLDKDERIAVEKEVISHIAAHAKVGICTSISDQLVLDTPIDPIDPHGSAYTFLCYHSLLALREWVRRTSFDGNIAYFFEAGDRFQPQANNMMETVFLLREERETFRYAGHAFVDKAKVRPVQTADVLAWHVVTDQRRQQEGKGRRADFNALLECETLHRHISKDDFLMKRAFWADLPSDVKERWSGALRKLGKPEERRRRRDDGEG